MKLYRQQIDELENHLQSAQASFLTPQGTLGDLILLSFKKTGLVIIARSAIQYIHIYIQIFLLRKKHKNTKN